MPTGQGFLGNDFEVTPPRARYAARNDGQLGLSPPRRIQMQEGRQLQVNPPQVVITLQAKNIQVRTKWQVSNAINAFAMDEYGDGALYLTANINDTTTLDVTVYLEDDFKLLNPAYDNLMVAATIRVEVILGKISVINPPLLYAAAGVAEIVYIFLPQGGKRPYTYVTPDIPPGFAYENGTLSIQADAVEGEYRLTVEIADAHNIAATAVATVTVESSHMIEVQSGGAVFISQGQEQSITNGIMFKFNPKSSSGVLVSATAESTVALMSPDNAWAITIYGGSQASFVGNGNGAVAVSLEGDSDFVRDTAAGAKVSLAYVFRKDGVVEAIVPIMPIGTRIFSRSQGGEWYLVIDEGSAQFAPRGGVNFLALNDAAWLADGQTPIKAQEFKFDDFMIVTVAHRYTGDVGSVIANYGVAPSFSLTNGAALASDRIGTQYYPRHGAKIAVEGPQGPLTLSYTVVAEDRLGDMLSGYGYTNRLVTVIATVVVEAPPVANFVGSSNVIYGPDAAAGKGTTISITLSDPPQADHVVLLSVKSDTGDYTLKVLGSDAGISCDNGHCSLLIPEGQTLAQLSVLTGIDISLSIVASDGEFVVRVYEWPVCLRTQQVRDEIMSQAEKSDCAKVTSADLANINAIYLYDSGITSLQHGDFDGLGNLQELDLESNNLTTLPSSVFDSLANLQELYLNENNLTTLSSGVFDSMGNLQELHLESNNLTTLPSGVFGSLGNLQELLIKKNALTTLPSGVFSGLESLQGLALSQNTLTTLPSGVFSGLVTLQRLGLSQNALTTLPSGVFNGLGNLQRLGLYSNALTALPSDVFAGLENLEYLHLNGNNLTTLPSEVFDGLDNLEYLRLSSNDLAVLPSDVFDGLGNLQWLYLHRNTLTVLLNNVFDGLGNLQELHLYRNALTTLPDVFDSLGTLQYLDLSSNALTALPISVFDGLGNLTELYLGHNALATLSNGVFDNLGSLQRLDLDNNALAFLPRGVFDHLGNLQRLGLQDNYLAALPRGMFGHLGNLAFLYLDNNACSFANQRSNLGIADPAYVTFGSGNGCLALFDAPPLPAIAGLPYALYHMAAQGGVGNHTYNIIGGNDSNYFAIDTNTGELSITTSQSQVGQYTLTIQVADGDGITQTAVASVHIASQQQIPQMAGFVGTAALLEKSKAAAGEG
ncbi:MAG: leucine-rich repeat domain-containing protein, partial [Gammaproteobacteria bacterium]